MREEFYQDKNITKHCAELEDWNEELKRLIIIDYIKVLTLKQQWNILKT